MIRLPFQMNFIFDFTDTIDFDVNIFHNLISEIKEIEPSPNIQIFADDYSIISKVETLFENIDIDIDINLIFPESVEKDFNYKNVNLVCKFNEIDKIYHSLEADILYTFKNIIIEHSEKIIDLEELGKYISILDKIKNRKLKKDICIKPYLTEREVKNYYTDNNQNRGFLTCAAPWITPIVKSNGDVYCCKYNKIGNIGTSSFWELWNGNNADSFRNNLIDSKQLYHCNNCNLFYDDTFLVAGGKTIKYKGIVYEFEAEINYVASAPKVIFIQKTKESDSHYKVDILPVYSDESLIEFHQNKKILAILS